MARGIHVLSTDLFTGFAAEQIVRLNVVSFLKIVLIRFKISVNCTNFGASPPCKISRFSPRFLFFWNI